MPTESTPVPPTTLAWPPKLLHPPHMSQCVSLAVLLHILLVLVFGTAPGGTARPGEGVWGALNVTLRGAQDKAGTGAPAPHAGPVGSTKQQRFGGAVRSSVDAQADSPGAARLGRWNEKLAAPTLGAADKPSAPHPRSSVKPVRQAPTPAAPPPASVAPEAETPPVSLPATTPLILPAALTAQALSGTVRTTPDLLDAPSTPSTFDQLKPMPLLDAPRLPPSQAETPRHLAEPMAEPIPASAPATAPPKPSMSGPRPVAATERSPAVTPEVSTLPSLGAPDAGSRLGHDVATPPSAPASAPGAKLNLTLPRGGELSSQSPRGLLQLLAHPPEHKSKLSEGIEKAAREDCRTAYGGAGLLAIIPLAADAAREKGCRW